MADSLARLVAAVCIALLCSACQTPPAVQHVDINGRSLPYIEQGQGEPVVLIHGAVADLRVWDRQRAALAARGYRTIAYTRLYYGTEPWQPAWPPYRMKTHVEELAGFIRSLDAGPVHLVAWSSGSHIAFNVALHRPELVKKVFVFEPVVPSYVSDPADLKAVGDDASSMVGPVFGPMKTGDHATAVRLFFDGISEQRGYFDKFPQALQTMLMDNARAMPLMFDGGEEDAPITCEQMAQIKAPAAIARGEKVRPFFRIIADNAARCMSQAKHIIVPNQRHMWPGEDPTGFSSVVAEFLISSNIRN